MGRPRRTNLSWRKKLVFALITVTVLLGIGEGGLRLYASMKTQREHGAALPPPAQRNRYQQEDPYLGYALVPGYDERGIRINTIGFRGPEIEIPKPEGTFRVVAIGDSCTFGLAGDGGSWTEPLGATWKVEGRRLEMINAGVEGYATPHGLRLLESRVGPLEPDVVMVYLGWNDIYGTDPFRPNRADWTAAPAALERSGPLGWLDRLYLVKAMRRVVLVEMPWLLGRAKGDDRDIHPDAFAGYATRLERMVEVTRDFGAEPVLMTLPTLVSETMSDEAAGIVHYPHWSGGDARRLREVVDHVNDVIRTVAADTGATLVDNAVSIDALGAEKEPLFFDTLHMYREGQAVLAEHIRRGLANVAVGG